mmetsp:Transcript_103250/g.200068  ORF Transcript_103250/g.200068 Transcript_103250/m.200068 type:complete len:99 (+) Transcript_103250:186-482(+)
MAPLALQHDLPRTQAPQAWDWHEQAGSKHAQEKIAHPVRLLLVLKPHDNAAKDQYAHVPCTFHAVTEHLHKPAVADDVELHKETWEFMAKRGQLRGDL